jgi:hypothetical protein
MRLHRRLTFFAFTALAAAATPAGAQVRLSQPSAGIGVRIYAVPFELQSMTAKDSFDAVLGKPYLTGFGGGVEVLRLGGDLFVRGAMTISRATGNRVVVVDDEVIEFDPPIPVTITALQTELGAGWRFTPRPRPGRPPSRVVSYVGGGLLFTRYREATDFDEPDEGQFESFNGYMLFGGVEFPLGGSIVGAGEVQYRTVPNALGDGGVSAAFGDTDLGGIAVRFLVGFRR